ncbi:MAG: hypothetical protein HC933_08425, partial [Pleurocapsa sp. SU_196_0]|nr:hypothetical protein [Pleurocapsa sp. SU_196_0]
STKIKVTHTLKRRTHDAVRSLVARGAARDVSSFIEAALERALAEEKRSHLQLELEAFEDESYREEIERLGDTGFEDLQPFLGEKQ